MTCKGLILAGGKGTRLLPVTRVINKHMVPILNRPMILFPLDTLKSLGITDIMIVSGGEHIGGIAEFLGDGSEFGVNLTYRVQMEAGGIGQALGLAKDFVGDDSVAVILGDNVFENAFDISNVMLINTDTEKYKNRAHIFVKEVSPEEGTRFGILTDGVLKFGKCIVEKPKKIETEIALAVTGLYIYPPDVFDVVAKQKPSARGEMEISDINNHYLLGGSCEVHPIIGFWSDAGTPESLKEVIDWAFKNMPKID